MGKAPAGAGAAGDLAQLSVAALAEQFTAVLDGAMARRQVPLARPAEWLIMAARLVALRVRLLLPAETRGKFGGPARRSGVAAAPGRPRGRTAAGGSA